MAIAAVMDLVRQVRKTNGEYPPCYFQRKGSRKRRMVRKNRRLICRTLDEFAHRRLVYLDRAAGGEGVNRFCSARLGLGVSDNSNSGIDRPLRKCLCGVVGQGHPGHYPG